MKYRKLILFPFALFVLFFSLFLLPAHAQQTPQPPSSPDEIIVKYKVGTPETEKTKMHKAENAIRERRIDKLRLEIVKVSKTFRDQAINNYKKNKYIDYAEPDYKAEKIATTNDPSLSQQWGLFKINAANQTGLSAWDVTTGTPSAKIAILDTGIETTHSDLAGKVISSSNFTTSSTTEDMDGHGTHVAGIAAAITNNGTGVAGTGYNASLINDKVLDDTGSGYYSWIANGIVAAADQGAQVINMSLGGTASSQALQDAINYAWSKGVVIVAAAGNSNTNTPFYPAYYNNVIAVAATDTNDTRASFSNYGNWVAVAAPGVNIYSTYKGNSYATLSGTSMASPFAAGTAALIWSSGLCADNTCVRRQLEQTADPIIGTGVFWTWGRINAYKAVTQRITTPTAMPTPTALPTNTPTPTATPTNTPTPTPIRSITVANITMTTSPSGTRKTITTVITVNDENTHIAVNTVSVKTKLTSPSGLITSFSGSTNNQGKVTFQTNSREQGTFTLTVTSLSKSTYSYHPTITTQTVVL